MVTAHHHTLDVYGVHLHAAFERDAWKAIRRDMPRPCEVFAWKNMPGAAVTLSQLSPRGPQHLAFAFNLESLTVAQQVGLIAHEALHAAIFITGYRGIETRAEGDEAAAYLAGWIAEWVWTCRP